jgi:hypothetical protein
MRRYGSHYLGILLFLMMVIFAEVAVAEIYKWVDAQGNIHFGDKPLDPEHADQAERVDIVESYQPPQQTDQEQEAYDREQESIKRRGQMYRQEDEERRKVAQDKHKEGKAALCAALETDIGKFGSMQRINGIPTYHYLKGEDGKSISSKQQAEIVEGLKREYAAAGCK